jgi:hypothetical protein
MFDLNIICYAAGCVSLLRIGNRPRMALRAEGFKIVPIESPGLCEVFLAYRSYSKLIGSAVQSLGQTESE